MERVIEKRRDGEGDREEERDGEGDREEERWRGG